MRLSRSLESVEPVDLHQLPGFEDFWKRHDLNVHRDANHFVNTLWLVTKSRAFTYRHAEMQAGGFLKDHVQMYLKRVPVAPSSEGLSLFPLLGNARADSGRSRLVPKLFAKIC